RPTARRKPRWPPPPRGSPKTPPAPLLFRSGWLVTPARRADPAASSTPPPLPVKTPVPPPRNAAWNATVPASFTEATYGANSLNRSPVVAITVHENIGQFSTAPGEARGQNRAFATKADGEDSRSVSGGAERG